MPRKKLSGDEEIELANRNAAVIRMRREGWAWRDIADTDGRSMSRCHQIFEEYRREIPRSEHDAWVELELDLLARGIADMLARLQSENMGHGYRVNYWKEVRCFSESRRLITGINAPVRTVSEMIDGTLGDARIAAEVTQWQREAAAAEQTARRLTDER